MEMRAKGKIILRTILGTVLLLAFVVLSVSCQKPEKPAGLKEKVTIGVAWLPLSVPIIIAKEKGFFTDEGLDMTFKPYPFGKKAMEVMFTGEADIATVAETPIVFNSFVRDDFVVFTTFTNSYNDSKIVGRKDKGVSRPEDLKGKKLGITTRTSSHFFTEIYLSEYGIDSSAVKLTVWMHSCNIPLNIGGTHHAFSGASVLRNTKRRKT